jgi:hypothetical protein
MCLSVGLVTIGNVFSLLQSCVMVGYNKMPFHEGYVDTENWP